MFLPFDITGSTWIVPTAVWEWEPVQPPAPPSDAPCGESGADAASTVSQDASTPVVPPLLQLVFKGYANTASFQWVAARSPMATPWNERDHDEPRDRRVGDPPPAGAESPLADPHDADAGAIGPRPPGDSDDAR